MGRQILFHMLPADCTAFFQFLTTHDHVIATARDADASRVEALDKPCESKKPICLWNRSILPSMMRLYIANADDGPYSRVDDSLPVLEFSPSIFTEWEGVPALLQGRIWGAFESQDDRHRAWFESIRRWIRKTYIKTDAPESYISLAVQEWRKTGGVLLPMFIPPATDAWKKFVQAQLVSSGKSQ